MSDIPGGPTAPPPPPPPPPPGSGGAPQGGIRPMTLGEILSSAFEIYRANAGRLLLLVAIVVVPLSLLNALFANVVFDPARVDVTDGVVGGDVAGRSWGAVLLLGALTALIGVLIYAVLQAAMIRAGAQATVGDPVDVEGSYRYGLGRLGSVLLVGLLVAVIVGIGFILLIVPGIILLVFLSVAIPALVVEDRRGTQALGRSWDLVRGNFWHTLGVIIVVYLIVAIVSAIIGAIGGDAWALRWIFTAIAQIVTTPFAALASVLLYLDLRARSEALSSETLRRELTAGA